MHSLASQGELLCTQGLAHIVNHPSAGTPFLRWLEQVSGLRLPPSLEWRAEVIQGDAARPDLEGRHGDAAWVKVEAKLGAILDYKQLSSFAGHLSDPQRHLLVVLVPAKRRAEALRLLRDKHRVAGKARRLPLTVQGRTAVVVTWEQVFRKLGSTANRHVAGDLRQLAGLYHGLVERQILPFAPDEISDGSRDGDLVQLVDKVTRHYSARLGHAVMPLGTETLPNPVGATGQYAYHRRYVVKSAGGIQISLGVGVRHPFDGSETRVWARIAAGNAKLADLKRKLLRGPWPAGRSACMSGGDLWFPLAVPADAGSDAMLRSLSDQIDRIWAVAEA